MQLDSEMKLTQHEQKILDIINSYPEILEDPVQRAAIAQRYGLTEKTLRNRIAEFKKYGLINTNNQLQARTDYQNQNTHHQRYLHLDCPTEN